MASGDSLLIFTATMAEPGTQTVNFATFDTRNGQPVLNFVSGTTVTTQFSGVLPQHYGGGGLTVNAHFAAGTATAGTLVVGMAVERIGTVLDIDADSYATTLYGTLTMPATSGLLGTQSIAFSNGAAMDSLAVGEGFRLQVQRVGTWATDTMGGTAQLRFIEIKET